MKQSRDSGVLRKEFLQIKVTKMIFMRRMAGIIMLFRSYQRENQKDEWTWRNTHKINKRRL